MSTLKEQAAALPTVPGVYQFVDAAGVVLYVGKAKVLRRRVANYFVDSRLPSKIRVMVGRAVELRHIVTDTETDALLLENSLIKRLQPQFNAMLKDDKTYPWIVVQDEPFPRIRSTRQLIKNGSRYFGPYASIGVQRNLLEILHGVFPFRTCKLDLSPENIARGRFRPCLEYHLGNCKAPCAGKQSAEEYDANVQMARAMLRGELAPIRRALSTAMRTASANLRFEEAAGYKHRLDLLEGYTSRSVVASVSLGDVDVFALVADGDAAYCNFARIVGGNIVNSFTVRLSLGAEEDERVVLTTAIQQIIANYELHLAKNVVVPFEPETIFFPGHEFIVPQRGEKRELLEFAEKNARMYRAEQLKNLEIKDPEKAVERVMEAMRKELHLEREPRWIECFDNSNLQGTNAVAACVVFRDGKPSRKEYRHFNVKTVEGADDFATMREIIRRRYSRLLAEAQENSNCRSAVAEPIEEGEGKKVASSGALPDLIVVDGGKGQLSAAYGVLLELGIVDRVPLIGLAERLEEVFFVGDPEPYYLKRNGEPLKVLMHIRDEAHRFGITHHRNKRSAAFIHSELEQIPGIGPKSIGELLRRFRSVKAVREASTEALAEIVGTARAEAIRNYFAD